MDLITRIEKLYQSVPKDIKSSPTEDILNIFMQAREIALTGEYSLQQIREVLDNKKIKTIQASLISRCAECEYEVERRFALECLKSDNLEQALINYRSYQRYAAMMTQEIEGLKSLHHRPIQKILFCGSGPLPISAFVLRRELGIEVSTLDYDQQTNDITCQMNHMLPSYLKLNHVHSNYYDYVDFRNFDVVMLAALVGTSPQEKKRVMQHLHQHLYPEQLALVRTTEGLRSLFYANIPDEALEGFEVLKRVPATPQTFNASVVVRLAN